MSVFQTVVRRNKPKRNVNIVTAGATAALVILKNGRAWGWGTVTAIGDNSATNKSTPVSVAGTAKTFCKISTSNGNTTLGLDKNGRLWSWGVGTSGELGDNTVFNKSTPVSVAGAIKTFCQISAGSNLSQAIDKNGRIWGWGFNGQGQIGDNTIVNKSTPVSVLGTVKTFCSIAAGGNHVLAIEKNGRLWSWGQNNFGQLGNNTVVSQRTPISVLGTVKTFCKISTFVNCSIAIDKNGRAWAWGLGTSGQLGDNTTLNKSTPVSVAGTIKTFCEIAAGSTHAIAIDKNGRAWGWGLNNLGAVGDGILSNKSTPVSVGGLVKTFCKISCGAAFSVAIDKNGRAWSWGNNSFGQIGNNEVINKSSPVSTFGATKTFCDISLGGPANAIDKNGRAYGWGSNSFAQLGDNTVITKETPISVAGTVKTFCKISVGNTHSLAIDKNGRVWGWGNNSFGQLADNTIVNQSTPISIGGAVKTFCTISSGQNFSYAIDKNGRVWSWGVNGQGQLGDNTTVFKSTPISVVGAIKTFCKIITSAGGNHCSAIDKNGRIWSWGQGNSGQLGDNTILNKSTPVSVAGTIKTFCNIASGEVSNYAIDKNGRAWSWGNNTSGRLGDNTVVAKSTPVSVAGAVKTFCAISSGYNHVLVIDKNGRAWAWGTNSNGQLGDNTVVSKSTPVSVAGAIKTFCKITAGNTISFAIDKNGRAWGWGNNSNGSFGLGIQVPITPVRVCNI